MQTTSKPSFPETILFGILFLFFLQLLTDFVAAIYAFGLMGLDIPPEIASVLFLFSPLLLVFVRRYAGWRFLAVLALVVIACRLVEPLLPTRERMLVAGLGVGSFLVFLPLLLGSRPRSWQLPGTLGYGLFLSLALAVLFRAAGSGVDLSTRGWFQGIAWVLALLAGVLLFRWFSISPQREGLELEELPQPASFWKQAGLSLGLTAALVLLYFAFSAPNVIARWTGSSYFLVLALLSAAPAYFTALLRGKAQQVLLTPRFILVWNLVFLLSLVLTLRLHQVGFPLEPAGYPFYAPPVPAWGIIPLVLTLLLSPVIVVDFLLFSREITLLQSSPRQLGVSFTLASLFLLLMIFAHVFTTVYDYIPVVGPAFRDRFWVVYLVAGLGMLLPLGLIGWRRFDPASASPSFRPPFLLPLLLAGIGLVGLASAVLNAPQPVQPGRDETRLRVLTYNIQQGYDAAGQKNFTGQLELIRQLDADIIGLQESDTNRIVGSNADLVRYLADQLDLYSYYGPSPVTGTFGIALLSKVPIENPSTFFMYSQGEQTAAIHAEITKAGKRFNVFVTHLGNGGPLVQQEAVLQEIRGKPDVIAMGDFNFSPLKPQYQQTLAVLEDAWLLRWPMGTDDAGHNPHDRIDHIFVSPATQVSAARFLTGPESDHPALLVEITW